MATEKEVEQQEPYHLSYLNGPRQGQKLNLDPQKPEIILGRSKDVDILIENKNISRKHAKFKQDIDGVWVEDLKSKNGVSVNEQKITESVLLKDGDVISLGDLKLSFVDSNAALIQRLSIVPAFQEANPEVSPESSNTPEFPSEPSEPSEESSLEESSEPVSAASVEPTPKKLLTSSSWPDYIYMGLMALVLLGLIVVALFWFSS